ncbi:MAG: adenosylcobalamin-dependent ribonucleoside-diphosphate reductase [Burkholderiales bacterium]
MGARPFLNDVSLGVWDAKYRLRTESTCEADISETWRRMAGALAAVEPRNRDVHEREFLSILENFRFLPGGRIQAGAGSPHHVTLFNCFVMGAIEDSLDGIFEALKEGGLTMQQGGGVGYDFSTLRPNGMPARSVGVVASGPISFMQIWDAMCATILSTGARRGAMMACLRCDHPDIEAFVDAKREEGRLTRFNLSVLVSDAFMQAVRDDTHWALVFPLRGDPPLPGEDVIEREWSGQTRPEPCRVVRKVKARALWERIMRATYSYAEPGVVFIDRVHRTDNLGYCERILATNPCGEIPLPAYGACDLGSINLCAFIDKPFSDEARIDLDAVGRTARIAVRMLDNVYDASQFPLARQAQTARASRRLGLGLTGLADALIMLGMRYGSDESMRMAGEVMRTIAVNAYLASIDLAKEKGAFPQFQADRYCASGFLQALPADLVDQIRRHGIRNSHLTAIAPTGTISLLANNVSSGLEPVYRFEYRRRIRKLDGSFDTLRVTDYAHTLFRKLNGDSSLPAAFVTVDEVAPERQLAMQAALQRYVDNAISKTINAGPDISFDEFRSIYEKAYELGLKGCTTFRPNPVTGSVLVADEQTAAEKQCCSIEREAD